MRGPCCLWRCGCSWRRGLFRPGCSVCPWAAARPLAVRAASFARRVASKPGQALPQHLWPTPNQHVSSYNPRPLAPYSVNWLFAFKGVGGVGVGRSGPECRWWRGRRAHPAASRVQVRMEGCGGEWFGVPVPRLFLFVGALHPIRRQCTSSVRVQRHVTGAPPRNGCSAPYRVQRPPCLWRLSGLWGSSGLELSYAWVFVASHVVVPQKCRTQFPDMYFKH